MMLPGSTVLHSIGKTLTIPNRTMMNRMVMGRTRLKKIALWGAAILLPQLSAGSKLRTSLLATTLLGLTYLLLKVSTLGLILAVLLWILFFLAGYIILTYSI